MILRFACKSKWMGNFLGGPGVKNLPSNTEDAVWSLVFPGAIKATSCNCWALMPQQRPNTVHLPQKNEMGDLSYEVAKMYY